MNKKLIKIIALCLSLSLVFANTVWATDGGDENISETAEVETIAEETAETTAEETEQEEKEIEIPEEISAEAGFLGALGMIDEKTDFDTDITRAETAELLIRMLGKESMALGQTNVKYYDDVESYSEISGYINAATTEGLFKGRSEKIFDPDSAVTYPELSKLLVNAVGYSSYAEKKGGFPGGYLTTAQQIKILKNVSLSAKTTVSWKDAVKMVFNAMNVDVLSGTEFDANGEFTELSKEQGENILKLNHGIYRGKGQITGTSLCKLFGVGLNRELKIGEIEINGHLLGYDEEKLAHLSTLTGYRTEYFYRETPNGVYDYELVYAYIEDSTSITLKSYDILDVNGFDEGDTGKAYLEYFIDDLSMDEFTKLYLDEKLALIVNNMAVPRVTNASLFPECGEVTLIDADNDEIYDVASVLSYETKIIDVVSVHDKCIYFKAVAGEDQMALKPLVLNPDYNDVLFDVTQDGKPIALRNIEEGDVVGIIESEKDNKPYYQIELLSSSIIGKVEEIGTEGAVIDGKTYKVADDFSLSDYEISLGEECELYFNYEDELFYAEKTEKEYTYQYVLLGVDQKRGEHKNWQMKVVYMPHFYRHEVQYLDLAEKVSINGKKFQGSAIKDALKLNNTDALALRSEFLQPIKTLDFDDEGKVKKMTTLPEGASSTRATRVYIGDGPYNEAFGEYKLSYDTQLFYVPNSMRDEDWTYGELDRLKFDKSYDTMMWGCTSEGLPEAVMIFHPHTSGNPSYGINNERPMIIDEVRKTWNAEKQEEIYRIRTYNSGGVFVYESDPRNAQNQNFDDLKPGDVIFAALTSTQTELKAKVNVILGGNMWNCVREIRLSDKSLSYYKAARSMYGVVETIRTDLRLNKCTLNMFFGDDGYQSYDISGVPIYYYDRGEDKVSLASYAAVKSKEHYGEDGASNVYVWLDEELDPAMIIIIGEK